MVFRQMTLRELAKLPEPDLREYFKQHAKYSDGLLRDNRYFIRLGGRTICSPDTFVLWNQFQEEVRKGTR